MKLFLRLIHWMYVENSERPGCHPLCLQEFYNCKYDPKNPEFWKQIELANGALFWLAWGWKIKKLFWKKSASRLFAYKLLQETGMQTGNWSWEFWCSMFCTSIGVSILHPKKQISSYSGWRLKRCTSWCGSFIPLFNPRCGWDLRLHRRQGEGGSFRGEGETTCFF